MAVYYTILQVRPKVVRINRGGATWWAPQATMFSPKYFYNPLIFKILPPKFFIF